MNLFGIGKRHAEDHPDDRLGIREFFRDTDRVHEKYRWWAQLVSLTAVLSVAWYLYASFHEANPIPFLPPISNEHSRAFRDVLNFLATAAIAIWASLAVVNLLNKGNILRIEAIKSLAKHDVLDFIFNSLRSYENRYAENKHVSIVFDSVIFSRTGLPFVRCAYTVNVRMKARAALILEFDKLSRDSGRSESHENLLNESSPDDLWSIDATEIERGFDHPDELLPGLTEVVIDNVPQYLHPPTEGSRSRWIFPTREVFEREGIIDVQYRFEYAQEIPGFCWVETFVPTHGLTCVLDFRNLLEDINCYWYETIHPARYEHDVRKDAAGVITVFSRQWVLPRATVGFSWYNKHPPPAALLPARRDHARQETEVVAADGTAENNSTPGSTAEKLSADGNCLGTALRDSWRLAGLVPPDVPLALLRTAREAHGALSLVRRPYLLVRREAGRVERAVQRLSAGLSGMETRDSLPGAGTVILCLRSMRQLYQIPRSEAHWVVIQITDRETALHDQLWNQIAATYPKAIQAPAEQVLEQVGPTFLV